MKRHILLFLLLIFIADYANAQASRWKRTRYEVFGGLGLTTFVGELGGRKKDLVEKEQVHLKIMNLGERGKLDRQ